MSLVFNFSFDAPAAAAAELVAARRPYPGDDDEYAQRTRCAARAL